MQWRAVVLTLLASAAVAHANGRAPGTSTIHFEQGHEQNVVAGMTFGLLLSHDGGATWEWMCEDAVGYGGMYDPDYSYTSSGAIFATTFDGFKVMRNGCTFDTTPEAGKFVSTDTLGPDGTVRFAASDPADAFIYASTDDGATFPQHSTPGQLNDWWQSLEVAPSDPQRLYLAGYRLPAGGSKQFFLFSSSDGGGSWSPMSIAGIATMPNSTIDIAGIDYTDKNTLYARVELDDNATTDSLYRSTDAGATWHKILTEAAALSGFAVRRNGDLVVGTQTLGAFVSHDKGNNWIPLAGAPHINCLVENSAGELWACTQNYGGPGLPSDDAGIMKTTDLATWTKVLKYQDIKKPVACAAGTKQHDSCAAMWCVFCQQIGCTVTPDEQAACTVTGTEGGNTITDAGPVVVPPKHSGSCDAGSGGATGLVVLGGVFATLLRPRKRRML